MRRASGKSTIVKCRVSVSLCTSSGAATSCSAQEMFQVAGIKHELKPCHLFQYGEVRFSQMTYVVCDAGSNTIEEYLEHL